MSYWTCTKNVDVVVTIASKNFCWQASTTRTQKIYSYQRSDINYLCVSGKTSLGPWKRSLLKWRYSLKWFIWDMTSWTLGCCVWVLWRRFLQSPWFYCIRFSKVLFQSPNLSLVLRVLGTSRFSCNRHDIAAHWAQMRLLRWKMWSWCLMRFMPKKYFISLTLRQSHVLNCGRLFIAKTQRNS